MKIESNCPRLPEDKAMTIPISIPGRELPQIMYDLRRSEAYKWKSAVIFYDNTLRKFKTVRENLIELHFFFQIRSRHCKRFYDCVNIFWTATSIQWAIGHDVRNE